MIFKQIKQLLVGATVIAFASLSLSPMLSASSIENADWYLNVDVQSLKNSQLKQELKIETDEGLSFVEALFGKSFIDSTAFITIYGSVEDDDQKTAYINGNYKAIREDLIKKVQNYGLQTKSEVNGITLYSGFLNIEAIKEALNKWQHFNESNSEHEFSASKDDEIENKVYVAFLNDNNLLISLNENDITSVVKNDASWEPQNLENLFEVVVDIEKAMFHGGVNLEEASEVVEFESISAKKLKQFSASYQENNGIIELQAGLKAADTETATKILTVVQGLMALKILSENNQVVIDLLNSIQIEQNGENLTLTLVGSVQSFKALMDHAEL